MDRFLNYLSGKNKKLNILDLGCGNGFFSNLMALKGHTVTGVDVNLPELKQAATVFKSSGIKWYYLDILQEEIPAGKFDIITFCCSFQYFNQPAGLLKRCQELLSDSGEIHIIDSPFYNETTRETARANSAEHFKSLGIGSMSGYYHHNTYEVFKGLDYNFKYRPGSLFSKLLRIKDSPFPWIMIPKRN
jgi:2-polyprenyl-3-methyl-5-hydroxy-6-metoxy-1,4-benzoquinol methylase